MNEVIHTVTSGGSINLTTYAYTAVYAGATASPTINGTVVNMVAGSNIVIKVKSISETADIYVIGTKKLISPTVING